MEQMEAMRISVQNVRRMVNNSILLLRDADLFLSKAGFQPLYGNTLGCEPSKSINQSYDQPNSFFPQYMSRYYSRKEAEPTAKVLCINVQFYHYLWDELQPCVLAGICHLREKGNKPDHWWMKYYAFEMEEVDPFKPDGSVFTRKDGDAWVRMWGRELQRLSSMDDVQKEITGRLLSEYEQVTQVP